MRLIFLFPVIFILYSCTTTFKYKVSDHIDFKSQEATIPLRAAVYIPDSTRKASYIATEKAMGMTNVFKTTIGEVLEPNALRALTPAFKSVSVVADSGRIADSIDVVVILSLDSTKYAWWSEGVNVCRRLDVVLKGVVINRRAANPIPPVAIEADGECYCKRYKCTIDGKVKGLNAGVALATTLAFGAPMVVSNIKGIFKRGTEGALQNALANFVNMIITNKDKLSS